MEAHLRSAVQSTLYEIVAHFVERQVLAARITDREASRILTALTEAICCAVANRPYTTFPIQMGEGVRAKRACMVLVLTFAIADPIAAAPGPGNISSLSGGFHTPLNLSQAHMETHRKWSLYIGWCD